MSQRVHSGDMRRFRPAAAALGIAGLALVGTACGGGTSASYHQGYTRGTVGASLAQSDQSAQDASQWCATFSPPPSIDHGQFTEGCLAGFKSGPPR